MGKSWIWHLFLQMAFHPVRPCWSASAQDFASNSGHAPSQGSHTPTHHHQKNISKKNQEVHNEWFMMVHWFMPSKWSTTEVACHPLERTNSNRQRTPEHLLPTTYNESLHCIHRNFCECQIWKTWKSCKFNFIDLSKSSHTHKTQGLQSNAINLGISNSNFKTCESLTSVISWTCQQLWNLPHVGWMNKQYETMLEINLAWASGSSKFK